MTNVGQTLVGPNMMNNNPNMNAMNNNANNMTMVRII